VIDVGSNSAHRARRRAVFNFAGLVIAFVAFAPLANSVGVMVLQAIRTLRVTKQEAAYLQPFCDLTMAISSIVLGSFLPSLGFRRSMLAALWLAIGACALIPTVGEFWVLKLHLALIGLCFAITKMTLYTSVGTLTHHPKTHASLMNTVEGLFTAGLLSGYWLFGSFSAEGSASLNWTDSYWALAAVLGLALTLFCFNPIAEQEPQAVVTTEATKEFLFMARLALKPAVLIYALSAFLYTLVQEAIAAWLPTFNAQVMHLPASLSIEVASAYSLSFVVGRLLGGALLTRVGWFGLLLACLAGAAGMVMWALQQAAHAPDGVLARFGAVPVASLTLPAAGLFLAPIYPSITSAILSKLPKEHHSAMSGLLIVFSSIGGTSGALGAGHLFQARGVSGFYFLLIPLSLLFPTLALFRSALRKLPQSGSSATTSGESHLHAAVPPKASSAARS
jgi:FHS family glucose/mannose:H+ symporter-like MFS transporter